MPLQQPAGAQLKTKLTLMVSKNRTKNLTPNAQEHLCRSLAVAFIYQEDLQILEHRITLIVNRQ